MTDVVTDPEQITAEWLTNVFYKRGYLRSGQVTGIKNKLTKKLPLSIVSRLEVQYSDDTPAGSIPSQLFLKIGSSHRKEAEFYNLIAPEMNDPPFIRCYHAACSSDSENYHLLLDDLSETHFQPPTPQPPAEAYCKAAVASLARLHAFWREDPRLGKGIGKLFDEDELDDFVNRVEKNVLAFLDFLGDRLSPEQHKIYRQMLDAKHEIWGRLTNAKGLTVTHGDAHWWNFLYPLEMDEDRVCLFDWQLWHVDLGARDMAFMVSLGGFSDRRPEIEQSLLRHYHHNLIAHGVKNYSWEDFENDYKWSAIRNLNIPAILWSEGRNEKLWSSNLERALAGFEDLKCSKIL
jgi:hypothetical protein